MCWKHPDHKLGHLYPLRDKIWLGFLEIPSNSPRQGINIEAVVGYMQTELDAVLNEYLA